MLNSMADIIGIAGAGMVLVSYAMLQFGKLKQDSFYFCLANFVGSMLILCSLLADWNLSAFIMESVWLVISGYGVWKNWDNKC